MFLKPFDIIANFLTFLKSIELKILKPEVKLKRIKKLLRYFYLI